MSRSRDKIEAIYEAASLLENEAQRTAYLNRACPDPETRQEIESRLAGSREIVFRLFAKLPDRVR